VKSLIRPKILPRRLIARVAPDAFDQRLERLAVTAEGTGTLVTDAYVLTAAHVLRREGAVTIHFHDGLSAAAIPVEGCRWAPTLASSTSPCSNCRMARMGRRRRDCGW